MSDQAAQPDQAAPEQAPPVESPSGPPEWLAPIEQRMNELRDQQMAIVDHLRQPPEDDPSDDEVDLEDLYSDDGQMTPELAQALIDQRVSDAVDERWASRTQAESLRDREDAWNELRDSVPDFADDGYAREIAQEVAEGLRAAGAEALIDTPTFVEMIEQRHKAYKFDERVAAEQPPQRHVVLESGQGAAPQQQDEEDWGERIVKAAERLRPKI